MTGRVGASRQWICEIAAELDELTDDRRAPLASADTTLRLAPPGQRGLSPR